MKAGDTDDIHPTMTRRYEC